ncbi:dentin sialophosphoprotein-like [Telopea speciosissima]|uniref:dentin sialophosphoprotein-like n=1 Tax=Telopea speciosissima TaxID=54955 RepID=UPI001CC41325|nr:dentin sialophosphoprotein-like [Telopea speciosissima]
MFKGQSTGTHTAGRTLGRCKEKEKEKTDAVVYIDIDPDDLSDVVVIDAPGSSQLRGHGSNIFRKDKSFPSGSIISVDDGDDDDESPGTVRESGGDLNSDATSIRASQFEPCQSQSSRTYSGKTISRNRFTFSSDSEDESSESDSSDCELMEGSFGKIRDQWEKASSKKKTSDDVHNSQSVVEEQGCGSGSVSDNQKDDEVENESVQQKANMSSYTGCEFIPVENYSLNPEGNNPVEDLDRTAVRKGSPSWSKSPPHETNHSERKYDLRGRRPFFFSQEQVDEQFNYESAFFHDKEENVAEEPCWFKNQSGYVSHSYHGKFNFQDKEDSLCDSFQTQVDQEFHLDKNVRIQTKTSCCNAQQPNDTKYDTANFEDQEKPVSGESSFCDSQPCFGKHINDCPEDSNGHTRGEHFFNAQSRNDSGINHDRFSCPDKVKSVSDESSLCNTQQDGTLVEDRRCFRNDAEPDPESLSETQLQDDKNPLLHALDGNFMPDVQNEIISEREKIKETVEYKCAVQEEWASRHRELQIQAEEARRLKQRKKAESMRLLDMERRQKQRVEEMRESQKKDEETINLKAQLRVKIRKELDRLELMYNDMASLLSALGINVGGGPNPTLHEVNAAYRRALLKFHPDRASRTDPRQQVEAEEKFKLISRLKEKFLPTF